MNADPDPDPATQINADPCGSGSETLVARVHFQVSDDFLQNVGLGVVWLVPCVRSLTYSSEGLVPGFG